MSTFTFAPTPAAYQVPGTRTRFQANLYIGIDIDSTSIAKSTSTPVWTSAPTNIHTTQTPPSTSTSPPPPPPTPTVLQLALACMSMTSDSSSLGLSAMSRVTQSFSSLKASTCVHNTEVHETEAVRENGDRRRRGRISHISSTFSYSATPTADGVMGLTVLRLHKEEYEHSAVRVVSCCAWVNLFAT